MNNQIQSTSIIRQRGQLTIPDGIREKVSWVAPGSVVTVTQMKPDEIIVRPYSAKKNKVDWDELWRKINLARSYKGKYKGSLSKFIAKDRETRR
ncbi:AbrB/MazE/SpoVT family DNA-binding domain-containing protein [Candidatus Gottesmanbacteria bacterium]|nr:AbrB/MazE/SpoVT family DNA-binding domain-containing protein [Candidatus Gottesmanbacteria bacterium]